MTHAVETGRNDAGWWFWRCACGESEAGFAHEVDARTVGGKHGTVIARV